MQSRTNSPFMYDSWSQPPHSRVFFLAKIVYNVLEPTHNQRRGKQGPSEIGRGIHSPRRGSEKKTNPYFVLSSGRLKPPRLKHQKKKNLNISRLTSNKTTNSSKT